jgi:hypothetical protein
VILYYNTLKKNNRRAFMTKTRLLGTVVPVGALKGSKVTAVGEFPDLAEFAIK